MYRQWLSPVLSVGELPEGADHRALRRWRGLGSGDRLSWRMNLGTAGSLQLLPSTVREPFLVMNGDVLTRLNPSQLLRFHVEHDAAGTLCVREHTTTVPFGVVQTNGVELAGFAEKPSYRQLVNAGVYVIDPQLLPSAAPPSH